MASFVVNAARSFRQDHLFRARSIHNGRPAGILLMARRLFFESVAGPGIYIALFFVVVVTVIGQTGGSDGWTRSG
jgi:hypothetical protein